MAGVTELPHYTDYDTRLAAYAVIVRTGDPGDAGDPLGSGAEVLLALWNEGGESKRWTLPGGGVELHETPAEAAVREVREETGYDVELVELVGVDSAVFEGERRNADTDRPLKAVRIIYSARIVGGELTREVGGSTDEARWFPLTEVASLPRVSQVDTALRLSGLLG